ncbi:hypothetical protein C8F01DRAFT_332250 [Mycena amicta]|nr:hypothetical protein C8F01DRAFT_332250 [Mycena amicta]
MSGRPGPCYGADGGVALRVYCPRWRCWSVPLDVAGLLRVVVVGQTRYTAMVVDHSESLSLSLARSLRIFPCVYPMRRTTDARRSGATSGATGSGGGTRIMVRAWATAVSLCWLGRAPYRVWWRRRCGRRRLGMSGRLLLRLARIFPRFLPHPRSTYIHLSPLFPFTLQTQTYIIPPHRSYYSPPCIFDIREYLTVLRHVPSCAGPSSSHAHLSPPIRHSARLLHERSPEAVPKAVPKVVAPYFWISLISPVVHSFFALYSHVLRPRPLRLRPHPSTSASVFGSRCTYDIFLPCDGRANPGPDGPSLRRAGPDALSYSS